jgi:hypothetical protein
MADEPFALSTVPPALPAQGDYDAICATVMESARGRWFLQEYARRNRNADTRLVLDAIERIEAVIRDDRGREAYLSFRSELQEMATTIAQTRAEVAELPPARLGQAEAVAAAREVFATAERIHEVAWTMRERGLDPSTCDQIEALSVSILSASSLRDPNDGWAHKLGEVLQYLERRINAMLESCRGPTPAASEGGEATGRVGSAPAGNGHDAFEPDAAARARSVEAPVETAPASADASPEDSTEPQPAHAQVETVELELAPLTVVPTLQEPADPGPPAAELEHAPIIVDVSFAPTANDAPATDAAAVSAQDLRATDLVPEPVLAAAAQPDSAPAAAEQPPGGMAALEVAPLVATPVEPPVGNDAPPVEIELDPIAIERTGPEPTSDAAQSAMEPALESAATPEETLSLATATALPMEPDAPAAAANPQPTTLVAESEIIERTPEPEAGGCAPTGAAATATAPIVPVEQTIEASSAEPIAEPASGVLRPEEEVAPPPAPAPEPVLSVEQSAPVIEPLVVPSAVDDAMAEPPVRTEALASTPGPFAPSDSAAPADSVTSDAVNAATEPPAAPAPDVAAPPAEPGAPASEPEAAELADFLLEPLPLPVTAGAAARPESGQGTASTMAPFDPMAEIEEELFAAAPRAASVVVPPAFDPAAILRPSAPMPMPEAAAPAAGRTPPVAPAAPPGPQPAPSDPLAALKAMTDEERIALFT